MRYPIGIQDFENIRRDGYVYVDKTESIYKLFKVGANFSTQNRRLEGWKVE